MHCGYSYIVYFILSSFKYAGPHEIYVNIFKKKINKTIKDLLEPQKRRKRRDRRIRIATIICLIPFYMSACVYMSGNIHTRTFHACADDEIHMCSEFAVRDPPTTNVCSTK